MIAKEYRDLVACVRENLCSLSDNSRIRALLDNLEFEQAMRESKT